MTEKARLFWILWAAGFVSVLSFLAVDLSAIIASVPLPPGEAPQELPPPLLLKIASVVQPTILVTIAVFAGVGLAGRIGLHAPAAEALAARDTFWAALRPQIFPGIMTGIFGGAAILTLWLIAKPYLAPEFIVRAEAFNQALPAVTRILYGGIVEELLLRWGVMTGIVWIAWRFLQKSAGTPKPATVIAAIFISALLFAIGHLPVAALLGGGLTAPLVAYVIAANSVFGIATGFLYWLRGLESAIIAHMFAHVVMITAIALAF